MIFMPKTTESKFLKVTCSGCKNEQIIFNKASTRVKCLVCGAELSEPTGGKARVKSKVIQVY
jgi:small subunit ribosomal protein S27e